MRNVLSTTISEIDLNHKLPHDFKKIGLKVVDQIEGSEGFTTHAQLIIRKIKPGGFAAKRIEIINTAPHPHLSLIHEIGHIIDLESIVPPYHTFSSESQLASDNMLKLQGLIRKSKAFERIYLSRHLDSEYKSYLLEGKELFARAYTQYIASRSNNRKILEELAIMRSAPESKLLFWSRSDFEPIAEALDGIVKQWK